MCMFHLGWPILSSGHPPEWPLDAGRNSEVPQTGEKDSGAGHTQAAVLTTCRLGEKHTSLNHKKQMYTHLRKRKIVWC